MKYYLIIDRQGKIITYDYDFSKDEYRAYKVDIEQFKKDPSNCRYLLSKELAEARKKIYSEDLKEELDVIAIDVILEIKIAE